MHFDELLTDIFVSDIDLNEEKVQQFCTNILSENHSA
jgi:hypothetical protein